jgi:signal transduction histidine kinase
LSQDSVLPAIVRVESAARDGERAVAGNLAMRVRAAGRAADEAQEVSQVAFVVATLLAVLIAIALWRSIAGPMRDFEAGMAAVAGGRFNHQLRIRSGRPDEFGRLAASFRSMADQLAQLDRLKAEFISVASHELKTPINVILGYVQLLAEEVYGPITERQCDILHTVEAQTQSLARLVHQLLDVSRFEAGGGKLEPRGVDVGRFLNELEQAFRVLSIQRGISFRVERGESLPDTVHWDADRVNEVLGNLLANAFKFTDRGGAVWLRVERLDNGVRIAVSDTGAGIPPEQLPHVFEKFYQASNQEAAAQTGTGLGLAIVQQIVVAHGGTISVDSRVGVGTTFELTLPVRARERVSAERGSLPAGAIA